MASLRFDLPPESDVDAWYAVGNENTMGSSEDEEETEKCVTGFMKATKSKKTEPQKTKPKQRTVFPGRGRFVSL